MLYFDLMINHCIRKMILSGDVVSSLHTCINNLIKKLKKVNNKNQKHIIDINSLTFH